MHVLVFGFFDFFAASPWPTELEYYHAFHCQALILPPLQYEQLLEAAENGHADEIVALLAEGANIEGKNQVRNLFLCRCFAWFEY